MYESYSKDLQFVPGEWFPEREFYSLIRDDRAQGPEGLYVSEIGQLQEHCAQLTRELRSLDQHLKSLQSISLVSDSDSYTAASNTTISALPTSQLDSGWTQPITHISTFIAPYMQGAGVSLLASIQDAWKSFEDMFQEAARCILRVIEYRDFLQKLLHRASVVLSIRFKAIFNAIYPVSLFCSVSWERRRWFLHHGARPPKPMVQAILGLFAGACSGSPIAY